MSAGRVRLVLVGLVVLLFTAPDAPGASLDATEVEVGDQLVVRLAGWPAGPVLVELCGNEAARGTVDCAVLAAVQSYVGGDGEAVVPLPVAGPPVPCPCVVRVRDLAGATTVSLPIAVDGFTAAPADPPARPPGALAVTDLAVTDLAVTGQWSWAGLFGGPAPRTIHLTLSNHGDDEVADPPLELLVGRGDHPTMLAPAPDLATIGPGAEVSYRLPVTLPPVTFGRYTIRGEVAGEVFLAETTSYPWGWPAVLAVMAAAALVARLPTHHRTDPASMIDKNAAPGGRTSVGAG